MNKYITIPRSGSGDCWDFYDDRQSVTVTEAEHAPVNTGLLNEHGTPLYRVTTREPIGFRVGRGGIVG